MTAFDREQARRVLRPYIAGFGYQPSPLAESILDALEGCCIEEKRGTE